MKTLCLVGCCKAKLERAAPSRELYTSPLFRMARAWAERHADAWAILSARFGCVRPEEVIEPYDTTIREHRLYGHQLRPAEFSMAFYAGVQAWYSGLCDPNNTRLVVLAGEEYCRPLIEHGRYRLELPLAGLGIGERLRWLKLALLEAA